MKCFFYVVILFITCNSANAQSLAINTTGATANASSILDISSTSKGVLVPRMTKAQKNAIATPATGLFVYQSAPDSIGFHYYNGSGWVWLNPSGGTSNNWSITGNTGTDTAVNFIGTTDNEPLRFKQNNVQMGQWNSNNGTYFLGKLAGRSNTTGTQNIGIGDSALYANTTGQNNLAMGYRSLRKNITGFDNTAYGYQSLYSNIASNNTAIGSGALTVNTIGAENTAIGSAALTLNTIGTSNTAIGTSSMESNINGNSNTAIGSYALAANTTGSGNNAIGLNALERNTTGQRNIAVGYNALQNNTVGNRNVAISNASAAGNTTGNSNISIGFLSLANNNSGSDNIVIGDSAALVSTNVSNLIVIGNRALVKNSSGTQITAIGDSVLYSNTTGYKNIAIGNSALVKNTTGFQNTAIGNNTLKENQTGFANIAIGDSALSANTSNWNIAIGSQALFSNTTGAQNTGVGFNSLAKNTVGINNTALGYKSMYKNTTGNLNVAIGDSALYDNLNGTINTAIGAYSLANNTDRLNTAIGGYSMFNNFSGTENIALGYQSLSQNINGSYNAAVGTSTLLNRNGSNNIALGYNAGSKTSGVTSFSNNIFIGNYTGLNSTGSNNIFIGDDVGTGSTASNILSIDNINSSTPLIFGNFSADLLRINGILNINSQYSFPVADGSANQYLRTNGAGVASWAAVTAESTTASNGLNLLVNDVKLGGTLTDSTTITQGSRSMVFDLNGTGDFYVRKNTIDDAFMVKNNGFIGLNTNDPLYRLHIVNTSGGNGPFGRGIVIENTNTGTNGEASIAFKNSGPGSVAANSAWMSGLNNAANYVIAYGDSLLSANVKMKLDTLGNVSIGNQGAAAQSKLDVKGSFGNAIRSITADYTTDGDDHTIIIATSVGATPLTVTLPAATTCDRREYTIVNRNGSIKTITTYNDFSGTSTALPANASITLQSNGTNWFRTR